MENESPTRKEYYCEPCQYKTNNHSDFNRHESTTKHICSSSCEVLQTYTCETCNYHFKTQSSYQKHLTTATHLGNYHGVFTCTKCNKLYANSSGLWKHNKACSKP